MHLSVSVCALCNVCCVHFVQHHRIELHTRCCLCCCCDVHSIRNFVVVQHIWDLRYILLSLILWIVYRFENRKKKIFSSPRPRVQLVNRDFFFSFFFRKLILCLSAFVLIWFLFLSHFINFIDVRVCVCASADSFAVKHFRFVVLFSRDSMMNCTGGDSWNSTRHTRRPIQHSIGTVADTRIQNMWTQTPGVFTVFYCVFDDHMSDSVTVCWNQIKSN